MVKQYMRICMSAEDAREAQLIVIHDTEENSEDILGKINEAGLIGNTVYLFAPEENQTGSESSQHGTDYGITHSDSDSDSNNSQDRITADYNSNDYKSMYGGSDYGDSDYDHYNKRKRRSVGSQAITNWNDPNKRIPLLKSLCQILNQSVQIIEKECKKLEQELIVVEPTGPKQTKATSVVSVLQSADCSVHIDLAECKEVVKEVAFVVEIPSEGLNAVLTNIKTIVDNLTFIVNVMSV